MTTFEYPLLILLSKQEQAASDLYAVANDDSRVRRSLKLMQERGWVKHSASRKLSTGPGAPMKFYKITQKGQNVLDLQDKTLEALR